MQKRIKLVTPQKCTGCLACYNICPHAAIFLEEDGEGFTVPKIDYSKCKKCGLCEKACPVLHSNRNKITKYHGAFACKNTIESERSASSSGGIFVLLANCPG